MSTINSWIKRNPLITALICILAVVALVGFISTRTNGFNDPEKLVTRQTNEDNLLQPGEDGNYSLVTQKTTEGLTITVNDNGSIKLTGTNAYASETTKKTLATVTLTKGTYTLSSGYADASNYTAWLELSYGDTVIDDFSGDTPGQFTLEADTEVTISLCVYPKDNWNVTIYPVLVAGDEKGSFWA